jgi:hypothetical protein
MAYMETNGIRIQKKKRRLTLSAISIILSSIIAITAVAATSYFAVQNENLLNSINNYQPFIFSNYTTSTLNTAISFPSDNDTCFYLDGLVAVDLEVITPYYGMLTIYVENLNFTHLNDTDYIGASLLDMNYLNYSEHSPTYMGITSHQYSISGNVINPIEDKLLVQLSVILKPNWLPPNATAIGFDLGDLTFEASLFAVRTSQTTNKNFTEDIFGMFTATS